MPKIPTVAEAMTPDPVTITPEAKLGDIIYLMRTHSFRHLPVVKGKQLVGIVTDRDVRLAMNSPITLRERTENQLVLETITAEGCMTPDPMTINADAPVTEAADLMLTYKFSSLPVMREGRLVGIITVTDLLRSYIKLAEQLEA